MKAGFGQPYSQHSYEELFSQRSLQQRNSAVIEQVFGEQLGQLLFAECHELEKRTKEHAM